MDATVQLQDGRTETYKAAEIENKSNDTSGQVSDNASTLATGHNTYRLEDLAYMRSGDKGDSCNIGVIARHPAYLPYIKNVLTEQAVKEHFSHLIQNYGKVHRYDVPGIHGLNFVLESSLGGGGIASIRPDPLGKAYGQILGEIELKNMPNKDDITMS